jgi:ferrochelatase
LNLGGPDSLGAVRPFLYNLFSDREIIRLGPPFLQKPLAWLISTIRSKKTKKFYSLISGKSPILDITTAQAKALEEALNPPCPPLEKGGRGGFERGARGGRVSEKVKCKTYVGMRYWHPFINEVVPDMFRNGVRKLIVLNMYPQYSHATTGSSLSVLKKVLQEYPMEVFFITSWFDHPLYIEALIDVIKKGLESFNPPLPPFTKGGQGGITNFELRTPNSELDIVLFSAHNLPESLIKEGDPYVNQINGTIAEITKRLNIQWYLSYQSKSGPVKWLKPSTDEMLESLAKKGFKNILIVPISFVSDHIETLYEIDILYKGIAERLGIMLKRVDSLNIHPLFIEALKDLVLKGLKEKGWV